MRNGDRAVFANALFGEAIHSTSSEGSEHGIDLAHTINGISISQINALMCVA